MFVKQIQGNLKGVAEITRREALDFFLAYQGKFKSFAKDATCNEIMDIFERDCDISITDRSKKKVYTGISKKLLRELYYTQKISYVCSMLNIDKKTLYKYLKDFDIPLRGSKRKGE